MKVVYRVYGIHTSNVINNIYSSYDGLKIETHYDVPLRELIQECISEDDAVGWVRGNQDCLDSFELGIEICKAYIKAR